MGRLGCAPAGRLAFTRRGAVESKMSSLSAALSRPFGRDELRPEDMVNMIVSLSTRWARGEDAPACPRCHFHLLALVLEVHPVIAAACVSGMVKARPTPALVQCTFCAGPCSRLLEAPMTKEEAEAEARAAGPTHPAVVFLERLRARRPDEAVQALRRAHETAERAPDAAVVIVAEVVGNAPVTPEELREAVEAAADELLRGPMPCGDPACVVCRGRGKLGGLA